MYGDEAQTTFPRHEYAASDSNQQQKPPYYQQQSQQQKPWSGQKGSYDSQKPKGDWGKKPFNRPEETDMTFYRPVAVFGNKDFPERLVPVLERMLEKLNKFGYTARCSGRDAIDAVVERNPIKKEVHLPWKNFNEKNSPFTFTSDRARAVAKQFFPMYDGVKLGVQTFLATNVRVLMGKNVVSPALFAICWTEDGVESAKEKTSRTGFSGHPIAVASSLGIPIFNLEKPDAEQRFNFYLESVNNEQTKETPGENNTY